MLTSKQILDAVSTEPGRGGSTGRVAYMRRSMRTGTNRVNAPSSHIKLLSELEEAGRSAPRPPAPYQHPGAAARAKTNRDAQVKNEDGHPVGTALTPADVAWISRLPQDPQDVSYEDAVTLAGLAASVSDATHASDARLVRSVWQPVKEVHDRRAADASLAAAEAAPTPKLPMSAHAALTEAIAAEEANLQPEEAAARAHRALESVMQARFQAYEDAKMQPQFDNYVSLDATGRRTAVTRDPSPAA